MCMGSKGKEHAKNTKEYGAPRRFEPPITTWAVALMEFEPRTSRAPYHKSPATTRIRKSGALAKGSFTPKTLFHTPIRPFARSPVRPFAHPPIRPFAPHALHTLFPNLLVAPLSQPSRSPSLPFFVLRNPSFPLSIIFLIITPPFHIPFSKVLRFSKVLPFPALNTAAGRLDLLRRGRPAESPLPYALLDLRIAERLPEFPSATAQLKSHLRGRP